MIDTHAHLGKVLFGKGPLTPEKLIAFMDKHGIEKSVILPLVNHEEEHYSYTTEQALEDCRRYPDRFIPFVNEAPDGAATMGTPISIRSSKNTRIRAARALEKSWLICRPM